MKFSVHSLKSKARALGAIDLSDTAAKLEKQCLAENESYINATLPVLYYEWEQAYLGLKVLIESIDRLSDKPIEAEPPDVGMEDLLKLLRHNRQPDALAALEQMIKKSQNAEESARLSEIREKVDEIELREAERLLIALRGDKVGT